MGNTSLSHHTATPRRPFVTDPLTAARAEALFVSSVPTGCRLARVEATTLITTVMRTHGGRRACAVEVAGGYGEYPEGAARRMRWARAVVDELYGSRTVVAPIRSVPTVFV